MKTSITTLFPAVILLIIVWVACREEAAPETTPRIDSMQSEKEYIRAIPGDNDTLSKADVERGKVLIAYSDCKTCHTEKNRAKGPAFEDIAKRYPINEGYIALLAQKVIVGGSGAWGYPVMSPHPDISPDDAKKMVMYILSLKK